jgi:mRNA-degrading endonuclease RelE of RelBE toxin-antitoxin system
LRITYSNQADTFLNSQTKEQRTRIKYAIKHLPNGDVKRLKHTECSYRLRVGDTRIIFAREGYKLDVIKIDNRGDVYKN